MLEKIPFPFSPVVLVAALPAAWVYRAARVLATPPRLAARAAAVVAVIALPAFSRGPGAVQLAVGLIAGYLGIRIVALGGGAPGRHRRFSVGGAVVDALELIGLGDLLAGAPRPVPPRAGALLALGVAGVGAGVALIWAGWVVRLWRFSPYLDDLVVCLEVALGTMGVNNIIIGASALAGRSVIGLQQSPPLSASLSEFWAVRWNRLVGRNLDRGFFRPACRAGHPAWGVVAAFVASGTMHVIPVFAAAPVAVAARPAAAVMGFFLLHAVLVLAERVAGLHRSPPPGPALLRARLRTVTLFVLLSPILLGPFAEICGIHGRDFTP